MQVFIHLVQLEYAAGVDISNLAAKKDFITLNAEVDKLHISKLVNFPTSLKNLKIKIDDLDFGKLKTIDLKN